MGFLAGVKYRDKIFFSSVQWNGLFSYDIMTGETKFLRVFERENIKFMLHNRGFLCGNEMWLIPARASHIACVNLDTLDISFFDLPRTVNRDSSFCYYDTVRYGDKLYVIPYYADNILEVDMMNHNCNVVYQSDIFKTFWASGAYISDHVLHVIKHDGNIGISIELNSYQVVGFDKNVDDHKCYYSMCLDGKCWFMSHEDRMLYKSDVTEDGKLLERKVVECENKPFYRGVAVGNSIILFPCDCSRTFMIIESSNDNHKMLDGCFDGFEESTSWFEMTVMDSDEGVWITAINGVVFDISNLENIKRFCVTVNCEQVENMFEKALETGEIDSFFEEGIIRENGIFITLNQYLKYVHMK